MFKKLKHVHGGISYHTYTYRNESMMITFSEIGATITEWQTINQKGVFESIILKYADPKDYLDNPKFLGSIIGPYAGRIDPNSLMLGGKIYHLNPSFGDPVYLHSGLDNFKYRKMDVETKDHEIIFRIKHDEARHNFPGITDFELIYTIEGNTLNQSYQAYAKIDTYTNITNHVYFNLSGNLKETILDHKLQIPSKFVGLLNEKSITKSLIPTLQTHFDFNQLKSVSDAILVESNYAQGGLDHPYLLSGDKIILHDPKSMRTLRIKTDQDAVVVYSNNFLSDKRFYPNRADQKYLGLCLETQHYPNDVHFFEHPKSYHPKESYHIQKTSYQITLEVL